MRLTGVMLVLAAALLMTASGRAQSLSPMHNKGMTPSDVKGFSLLVGNPYKQRMTFVLVAMDPGFSAPVEGAEIAPSEVTLAPGYSRRVIAAFKIFPDAKERTIAVCVMPKKPLGTVMPRVCGTYTGLLAGAGG